MIVGSDFRPAWWLPNSHIQTIYPTLTRRIKAPVDVTERIELADGDFIDLAWAINGQENDTPLVILLHGLGGSVESAYVAGLMHAFNHLGWRAVLMHFRGASQEPNRLIRAYHSGDTADLNSFLHLLSQREPYTKKAAVGVSMGGNVLLKWLGEQGGQTLMDAAVAVCVPFQLNVVADRISQGFSRVYQSYLLRKLKTVFARKQQKFPDQLPQALKAIDKCQCFWTFDEFVTAPLNGFSNVHAYYRESSSRYYLRDITTRTLIIHALDDPFMTPEIIPEAEELSDSITLELSKAGGHVGFISGNFPGKPVYWLEQRIPEFLEQVF
ncbi:MULTISPECIES: hydrolase [unclassified Legionella]|uniref:hydrolase n=1 Tax=unclassified Legionella TaxID=2622702 RepID=UPI001054E853|nr:MULTISPECIES: hydrolase [unclassified Legionella]MDI9817938.1 hydrolase [Legionella sp. PL877]